MKITKVSYGKTYPLGNYSSERIDLEATVEDGENRTLALSALKEICDIEHKQNNPHLYQEQDTLYNQIVEGAKFRQEMASITNIRPPELEEKNLTQEQKFLNLISLATSTKELSMYEKTANNPKYPSLKTAYDNKYNQLTTPNKV